MATCLVLLSLSSQRTASTSNARSMLDLQAPSGLRITTSIQQLEAEAARVILYKHNMQQEFKINNIEYLPVTTGYAAIISYTLQDGTAGNFGMFYDVKLDFGACSSVGIVQQGSATNYNAAQQAAGKATITCRGNCPCSLSAVINTDTGTITVNCGCSGCEPHMTQSS